MAFSFVNSSYTTINNQTSVTVNKPTNTADGDIMFAFLSWSNGNNNTVPSGWTQCANVYNGNQAFKIMYKIASSEGSSYTWGFSAQNTTIVSIVTYRGGFDSSNPINSVSQSIYNTNNNICRAASFSPTVGNCPIILFQSVTDSQTDILYSTPSNPNSNWTQDFYNSYYTSPKVSRLVWDSSGSTGNIDSTMTYHSNQYETGNKQGLAVALNPEPTSLIKSWNGLAKSSIKSINGLAIASVKSINGLS